MSLNINVGNVLKCRSRMDGSNYAFKVIELNPEHRGFKLKDLETQEIENFRVNEFTNVFEIIEVINLNGEAINTSRGENNGDRVQQSEEVTQEFNPQEFLNQKYEEGKAGLNHIISSFNILTGNLNEVIEQKERFLVALKDSMIAGIPNINEFQVTIQNMLNSLHDYWDEKFDIFANVLKLNTLAPSPKIPEVNTAEYLSFFNEREFLIHNMLGLSTYKNFIEDLYVNKVEDIYKKYSKNELLKLIEKTFYYLTHFKEIEINLKNSYDITYKGNKLENCAFSKNHYQLNGSIVFTKIINTPNGDSRYVFFEIQPEELAGIEIKVNTENAFPDMNENINVILPYIDMSDIELEEPLEITADLMLQKLSRIFIKQDKELTDNKLMKLLKFIDGFFIVNPEEMEKFQNIILGENDFLVYELRKLLISQNMEGEKNDQGDQSE